MTKAKILIVEDETIISAELEISLESLGHKIVAVVCSGEEAIEKADVFRPDIVLMDIQLEGIDAAKIVKDRFGIPVIFLTAYADEEKIDRAKFTLGYLLKPVQEKSLKITIEMALHLSRSEAERKKVVSALKASERNMRIRNDINNIFLTHSDENVFEEILNLILKIMDSEFGTFGYFKEDGSFVAPALTRKAYWDKCNIPDKDIIFAKGSFCGIFNHMIKERKTLILNEGPFHTHEGHIVIQNSMITPIIFHNELISAIHLANKPNGYHEEDQELLETIANIIAPVLFARLQVQQHEKERNKMKIELQKNLDFKKMILATSPIGIVIYDEAGKCVVANESAAKSAGAVIGEVLSQNYHQIVSWKNSGLYEIATSAIKEQKTKKLETSLTSTFGKQVNLEFIFSPFSSGKRNFLMLMVNDIRDRIEAEEKHNKELEKAKMVAEDASIAKSNFLSHMSHELRTPLNAILGYSQLLQRDSEFIPDQIEKLNIIKKNSEYLLYLINDILEIAKIESGNTTLDEEDFDLFELLDSLKNTFNLRTREKRLKLIFSCSPEIPQYIRTDDRKLRQVLFNLLSNGVKFTDKGSVSVFVTYVHEREHILRFEVRDTGSGITPIEIDRLFSDFVQTKKGRKEKEGTGLGLAISQKFIRMMGGEITVDSKIGQGSVFIFKIEIELSEKAKVASQKTGQSVIKLKPNQKKTRILVIEDQYESRHLLKELLQVVGFEVKSAVNGQEGIEQFFSWHPDLIFMDMKMPGMDGYEATRIIKSVEYKKVPPVIAITGMAFEEDKKQILAAGCDDFIRKPYKESEIFDVLKKYLGIEYIYNESGQNLSQPYVEPATINELTKETLSVLPEKVLKELKTSAVELNQYAIKLLIKEFRNLEYNDIAYELEHLNEDFQFEKIVELVE